MYLSFNQVQVLLATVFRKRMFKTMYLKKLSANETEMESLN